VPARYVGRVCEDQEDFVVRCHGYKRLTIECAYWYILIKQITSYGNPMRFLRTEQEGYTPSISERGQAHQRSVPAHTF
jgi:hypothetical protein